MARRLLDGVHGKREEAVSSSLLRKGDLVVVEANQLVPGDGEIVEGIASVDESAITGESAPVIRESGGDRSAVTGGTKVLSDRIVVRIVSDPGESFLDRMIGLVEGASRQKTPNEIALHILLVGLTIVFLFACVTLVPLAKYSSLALSATAIVALLVCLIPTTIGGLLSAIGIAGMDRLLKKNVIAISGRAVEAAGDVDTLLLDKTGTITHGNRMATELLPLPGVRVETLAEAAQLASLADETPEGRSIVTLARDKYSVAGGRGGSSRAGTFVPFTAQTRMSGLDFDGTRRSARAPSTRSPSTCARRARQRAARARARSPPGSATPAERRWRSPTARPFWGSSTSRTSSRPASRERFERFRAMGIRTVMITGDNPRTAAAIATEAGVDDFLAEATPEAKMRLIKEEQAKGKLVAMTGDGTNDAPALAQADVGVAMNSGTQAAKEAGNMVDLDSNPTKLLEIVEVGKQLLMTRGTLTTFSIANDVAKYFAILPAMFMVVFPEIAPLNVMHLASPYSRHPVGGHLQRRSSSSCSSRWPCAGCATGRSARRPSCAARCSSTASGASSRRSSASSSSTSPSRRFIWSEDITMRKEIVIALRVTLVTLVLTGLVYPLATTGAAEAPVRRARQRQPGPRRERAGGRLGADRPGLRHARLPAGASVGGRNNGYDATSSSGSNFGTTSKKLRDRVAADVARLQKENPSAPLPIPDELVTASASGLDPDLSPDAALWQAPRIARGPQRRRGPDPRRHREPRPGARPRLPR